MRVAAKLLGISSKKITAIWRSYFSRGLTLSGLHFVGGGGTNKQTDRTTEIAAYRRSSEGLGSTHKDKHSSTWEENWQGTRYHRIYSVYLLWIVKKNGCLVPGLVE